MSRSQILNHLKSVKTMGIAEFTMAHRLEFSEDRVKLMRGR